MYGAIGLKGCLDVDVLSQSKPVVYYTVKPNNLAQEGYGDNTLV